MERGVLAWLRWDAVYHPCYLVQRRRQPGACAVMLVVLFLAI